MRPSAKEVKDFFEDENHFPPLDLNFTEELKRVVFPEKSNANEDSHENQGIISAIGQLEFSRTFSRLLPLKNSRVNNEQECRALLKLLGYEMSDLYGLDEKEIKMLMASKVQAFWKEVAYLQNILNLRKDQGVKTVALMHAMKGAQNLKAKLNIEGVVEFEILQDQKGDLSYLMTGLNDVKDGSAKECRRAATVKETFVSVSLKPVSRCCEEDIIKEREIYKYLEGHENVPKVIKEMEDRVFYECIPYKLSQIEWNKLTEKEVYCLGRDITNVLAKLHKKYAHHDIHWGNILFKQEEGQEKKFYLIDFELAIDLTCKNDKERAALLHEDLYKLAEYLSEYLFSVKVKNTKIFNIIKKMKNKEITAQEAFHFFKKELDDW